MFNLNKTTAPIIVDEEKCPNIMYGSYNIGMLKQEKKQHVIVNYCPVCNNGFMIKLNKENMPTYWIKKCNSCNINTLIINTIKDQYSKKRYPVVKGPAIKDADSLFKYMAISANIGITYAFAYAKALETEPFVVNGLRNMFRDKGKPVYRSCPARNDISFNKVINELNIRRSLIKKNNAIDIKFSNCLLKLSNYTKYPELTEVGSVKTCSLFGEDDYRFIYIANRVFPIILPYSLFEETFFKEFKEKITRETKPLAKADGKKVSISNVVEFPTKKSILGDCRGCGAIVTREECSESKCPTCESVIKE